ncbi:MAG TPA: heavy-metal-associated domain-containing protein [Haliangiales bacterium]|nr:heavy-metal-associated domain-containing protein [Haliangiales bacterium]
MKLKMAVASSLAAGLLASVLAIGSAFACDGKEHEKNARSDKPAPTVLAANVMAVNVKVSGMHCEGCADKIKAGLAKLDGIVNVDVKVADGLVAVKYDKTKTTAEKIAKAINELGYKAAAEA